MGWRTPTAIIAASTTAFAIAVVPIISSADEATTSVSNVYLRCDADVTIANSLVDGLASDAISKYLPYDTKNPLAFQVTAPTEVSVGEEFEVVVTTDRSGSDGGVISFNIDELLSGLDVGVTLSNTFLSRLKLDMEKPAGTELVDFEISGDTSGLFDGATIITVNESGQPDPAGNILRVVDSSNTSVGNSSNNGNGRGGLGYDIRGNTIEFSVPTITLKLRATEAKENASLGLRTPTTGAATDSIAAFISTDASVGPVPVVGSVNTSLTSPLYCGPTPAGTSMDQEDAAGNPLPPLTVPTDNGVLNTFDIVDPETSTTLVAEKSPQVGVPTTFTAAVTRGVEGDVTFTSGNQSVTSKVNPNTGRASGDLVFDALGDVNVTARFTPTDSSHNPSSATETFTVGARSSALQLSVPIQSTVGRETEISATISPAAEGIVRFTSGDQVVDAEVDVATGEATTSLTFASTGTKTVSAEFIPAHQNTLGAKASANIVVGAAESQLSLELPQSTSIGQTTDITAVVPVGVEGAVTFLSGSNSVEAQVDPATGRATAAMTFNSLGEHSIRATFTPTTPGYNPSTTSANIRVSNQATSLTVYAPETAHIGETIDLSVDVSPASAGSVTFRLGTEQVRADVDPSTGVATAQLQASTAGEQQLSVNFVPSSTGIAPASATKTIQITQRDATLELIGPQDTIYQNVPARFNAQLPIGARGTVTFSSGEISSSATVDPETGMAQVQLSLPEAGLNSVVATFSPTAQSAFGPATVTNSFDVAEFSGTQLVFGTVPSIVRPGDELKLHATVRDSDSALNSDGTVTFSVGRESVTSNVVDGSAEASIVVGAAGDYEVTATYTPALDNGQESATTATTVSVVDAPEPSATLFGTAVAGKESAFELRIDEAVDGTATISIDGIEAAAGIPVVAGVASVPLKFPATDADKYQVRVDFVPADPRLAARSFTELEIDAVAPIVSVDDLEVAMYAPITSAQTGENVAVQVFINESGESETAEVEGFVKLSNNGEILLDESGNEIQIPVAHGVADLNVQWLGSDPEQKNLTATFFLSDGTQVGSASEMFSITGADRVTLGQPEMRVNFMAAFVGPTLEQDEIDGLGDDQTNSGGSSSSSNLWSGILPALLPLINFLKNLFRF
ncbi:hypothetical protein ACXZ66_10420 [Corynebacterium sp. S7]